jgi:RHS repeat-associated protein
VADVLTLTDYYAFGQAITERTYNAAAYKYGYNGKEKDNELYGEGNAYDFGARINDPRLGRWLSLDPLAAKYPSMSPYCSMGNNPIVMVDPDGREITPANERSRVAYQALKAGYKTLKDQTRYETLLRMEDAKDVVFKINVETKRADLGVNDATDRYNAAESTQEKVIIDVLVAEDIETTTTSQTKNVSVALSDELEHGRQFLDGEIGLTNVNGRTNTLGYDKKDELNSQEATLDATAGLNNVIGAANTQKRLHPKDGDSPQYPEIQTNELQNAYKLAKIPGFSTDAFLSEYYPNVKDAGPTPGDEGKSTNDQQKELNGSKVNASAVFRRDNNDCSKKENVIITNKK